MEIYNLNLSSPLNPDITALGYPPPGWTQWAALYRRYSTTHSTLSLKITPTNSTSVTLPRVCVYPMDVVTVPTSIDVA